jgi:hypothetical protein
MGTFIAAVGQVEDHVVALGDYWRERYAQVSSSATNLERHLAHGAVDNFIPGCVYLIENADRGTCKIGDSLNPEARLATLLTSSPDDLVLRSAFRGSPADERALHKNFAAFRLRREWFRFDEQIAVEFTRLSTQRASSVEHDPATDTAVA